MTEKPDGKRLLSESSSDVLSNTQFVEIYRAENVVIAQLLKGALEDDGIPAQITDESYAALAGGNPIWWESPRILVGAVDAARAAAIIHEIEAARRTRSASRDAD
ncbi:MAG TPA: DUF2007 domain-containing protein [Planctomycetaceae bacterium]|jgi:hypothetical protein|nr:DUF2007 domain-containing protein [Planctomycetaceae bacterium]